MRRRPQGSKRKPALQGLRPAGAVRVPTVPAPPAGSTHPLVARPLALPRPPVVRAPPGARAPRGCPAHRLRAAGRPQAPANPPPPGGSPLPSLRDPPAASLGNSLQGDRKNRPRHRHPVRSPPVRASAGSQCPRSRPTPPSAGLCPRGRSPFRGAGAGRRARSGAHPTPMRRPGQRAALALCFSGVDWFMISFSRFIASASCLRGAESGCPAAALG